jgi:hypothetical protein
MEFNPNLTYTHTSNQHYLEWILIKVFPFQNHPLCIQLRMNSDTLHF